MTVELLAMARSLGAEIRIRPDGRLGVRGADRLTEPLREAIRQHRDELVRHLVLEDVARWPLDRRQRWADRTLQLFTVRAVTTLAEQLECEVDAALELLGEQVN